MNYFGGLGSAPAPPDPSRAVHFIQPPVVHEPPGLVTVNVSSPLARFLLVKRPRTFMVLWSVPDCWFSVNLKLPFVIFGLRRPMKTMPAGPSAGGVQSMSFIPGFASRKRLTRTAPPGDCTTEKRVST